MTRRDDEAKILEALRPAHAREQAAAWVAAMGWGDLPAGVCAWLGTGRLPELAQRWTDRGARLVLLDYDGDGARVGLLAVSPVTMREHHEGSAGLLLSAAAARVARGHDERPVMMVCGPAWQWIRAVCRWEPEGWCVVGVRSLVSVRQVWTVDGRGVVVGSDLCPHSSHLRAAVAAAAGVEVVRDIVESIDTWGEG